MNEPGRGEASGSASPAERVALLFESKRETLLGKALDVLGEYGSDATAEGVLQDTWIAVSDGVDLPVDEAQAVAVIVKRVGRLAANRRRYEKLRSCEKLEVADVERPQGSPEEPALARIELEAAMPALTPSEQEVVVLREVEGWSVDQIAEGRGSAPGTVKTLLKRGRRKLRAHLGRPRRRARNR